MDRDKRHAEVSMLTCQPIAEPAYGNWSMAFVERKKSGLARHEGSAEDGGFDPSRMTGIAVSDFLHSLLLAEEQETDSSS